MAKEYGKLSESQFKRLIGSLPEFRREAKSTQDALRAASKENIRELLGDGIWWAPVYELPLAHGLALLVYALGEVDRFKALAQLADPQEAFLTDLETDDEFVWDGGPDGAFIKADVVGLATVLQKNVLSIMIYQQSLSSLIAQARDEGNDEALFKAIRVDRSAMSCPSAASRISEAELLGQKGFFRRLISALKGPSKKHMAALQDLRYSLAVLRELGFDQLSDVQLEHLLVDVLQVYPPSYTARKNLRKQYYESKKIKGL